MSGINRSDCLHDKPSQSTAQREKKDQHGQHTPREGHTGHDRRGFGILGHHAASGASPRGGVEQESDDKGGEESHVGKLASAARQFKPCAKRWLLEGERSREPPRIQLRPETAALQFSLPPAPVADSPCP